MASTTDRNKQNVIAFYQGLYGDKDLSVIDKYMSGTEYIEHSQIFPNGREPFRAFVTDLFKDDKTKETINIVRSIAEGDLVFMHVRMDWDGKDSAIAEIYRLDADGKIVEHWDVIQAVPTESNNGHPSF